MSGFYADNSRIRVLDTVNEADQTVFDTDENMAHIIGTAEHEVEVAFTNLTQTQRYHGFDPCGFVIPITYGPFSEEYCYGWETCSYLYGECDYFEQCFSYMWFETEDLCVGATYYKYYTDAREVAETQDICALPTDEDGNAMDVDFVIIQATGSRTTTGNDPLLQQAFVSSVPGGTFSLQGSMFLEGANKSNGTPWFRRICSVVVDNANGKLKLKRQESATSIGHPGIDTSFSLSAKSVFNFTFKIFFGRFKE